MNREDYSNIHGERYDPVKPKDSDILKGKGSFVGETVTSTEFVPKHGERYETHRPTGSDVFRHENSSFDGRTWTQEDFGPKTTERAEPARHMAELRIDTGGM